MSGEPTRDDMTAVASLAERMVSALDDPVPAAFTAAVVGPNDVLVLSTVEHMTPERAQRTKDACQMAMPGLKGRVLVVSGLVATIVKDGAI